MAKQQAQSREERIKANALKALEEMGTPPDMEVTESELTAGETPAEVELIEKLKIENAELVEKYMQAQSSLSALSETIASLQAEITAKDEEIALVKAEISNDVE